MIGRWLARRGMQPEDRRVVFDLGREDLLADLLGFLATEYLAIQEKPEGNRTAEEARVFQRFANNMIGFENQLVDLAVRRAESFLGNPCGWTPDPEIAAQFALTYDGQQYCQRNPLISNFRFFLTGPRYEYFYAEAFANTFGKPYREGRTTAVAVLAEQQLAKHVSAFGLSAIAGAATGAAVNANPLKTNPFSNEKLSPAKHLRFARFLGGGAFSIVTFMANIGIEAIIMFAEDIKFREDVANLKAKRAAGVDFDALLQAPDGLNKMILTMERDRRIQPSRAPLPKHRPGVDRLFIVRNGVSSTPSPSIEYKDHNGDQWTVSMWDKWFIRYPASDPNGPGSITPDLDITDDAGRQWILTRIYPDRVQLTQVSPPENARRCPAVSDGISEDLDWWNCSVFFTSSFRMELANGDKVGISLGRAPQLQNTSFFFPANTETSHRLEFTGEPLPALRMTGAAIPSWLRLVNGSLVGNPGTAIGFREVSIGLTSVSGNVSTSVTVYFGVAAQIVSSDTLQVFGGVPFSHTILATGTPRPAIRQTGPLPPSFTVTDNRNGTATLRGTWDGQNRGPCYRIGPIPAECNTTVEADNLVGKATQMLKFNFSPSPQAAYTGPTELPFIAGLEGRILLTSTGARTPVEWNTANSLRDLRWLRIEQRDNGMAMLIGTPPLGTSFTQPLTICPIALGSGLNTCELGNVLLSVDAGLRSLSPVYAAAAPGATVNLPLLVNSNAMLGNFFFDGGALPRGLEIRNDGVRPDGTVGRVGGTLAPNQGGRYTFRVLWTDLLRVLHFWITLDVVEPARITSPPSFTFFENTPAQGEVTTSGYPVNAAPVDCGQGRCTSMTMSMRWDGTARLQDLTLSNTTPDGAPLSIGRFTGAIPAGSRGLYRATLAVNNQRDQPEFRQPVQIVVLPTADLNGDGRVDCLDLTAIRNAAGSRPAERGTGFDVTGDNVVDDKDVDGLRRAVASLGACEI